MIKNERDSTKTCIVFEQSSKIGNNPSLNDFLHSGPCLLPLIFNILLRFRIGDVALVADIKQAFLHIEIEEGDADFCGWKIFQKNTKFLRVVFGVTSSPSFIGSDNKVTCNKIYCRSDCSGSFENIIVGCVC